MRHLRFAVIALLVCLVGRKGGRKIAREAMELLCSLTAAPCAA